MVLKFYVFIVHNIIQVRMKFVTCNDYDEKCNEDEKKSRSLRINLFPLFIIY